MLVEVPIKQIFEKNDTGVLQSRFVRAKVNRQTEKWTSDNNP